ncbi:spermidine synthase [Marinomonas sp. SBI22]|uniref:polyamine aminopropyltransferase n=1 Tax=unclassified Marinomonas TaxID=196814 RepID=UPI0007AF5C4A|nr:MULTISPECIES: polyamine aminopropyltransferase [unclassified Marinomonas]KZM41616.1 spermidine synthase [Marinomonas sp. SBI22]KZM43452.1 spermidine synthase [Marinomonas sp. SBI8L]
MTKRLLTEALHTGYGQSFEVDEVLFEIDTDHQHLVIFNNSQFGRIMALDGVIQTTERDEFIYHEMMAHVPMFAHGNAKKVLIIGGGDGGMLREVLRHPGVEQVTQVEIDQAVVDMCTKYLPNHSAGAYEHEKTQVVIADGVDYVNETDEKYDVIISDCTDPIGPGEVLFSSRFYEGCKRCLTPGGVFVAQNGVSFMQIEEVTTTAQRLKPYFADQSFYSAAVPTYVGGIMTFAWATDNQALRSLDAKTIRERFETAGFSTRFYTPEVHQASFALPQYVIDAI